MTKTTTATARAKAPVKPSKKSAPAPKAAKSASKATDDDTKAKKKPAVNDAKAVSSKPAKTKDSVKPSKKAPAAEPKTKGDAKASGIEAAVTHELEVGSKGQVMTDGELATFKVTKLIKTGYKVKFRDGTEDKVTFEEVIGSAQSKVAKSKSDDAPKQTGNPLKNHGDMKRVKSAVSDFLRDMFGFVDTGDSFYVTPPESETALSVFVLSSHEDVLTALSHVEAETYLISGEIIAVRRFVATAVEKKLKAGHARGAIQLLYQTTFDPRGMNPASWETEQLSAFVTSEQIASAKQVKSMNREKLLEAVTKFGNGTDDSGAVAEDSTDKTGEALAKLYDQVIANKSVRGKANERRDLIKTLAAYRDDLFERGRKTRIGQLRKLVKELTELNEKVRDQMLDVLSDAQESIAAAA